MKSHHRGKPVNGALPVISDTLLLSELLEKAGPRMMQRERSMCAELAARLELGGPPLTTKERDAALVLSKTYGTLPKIAAQGKRVRLHAGDDCYSERPCAYAEQHLAKYTRRENGEMLAPPGRRV